MRSPMKPLIITAALVGAEVMRDHTPYVPYSPEEIAQEALQCRQAGASMVHVHGRLDDGTPTQSRPVFQKILQKIRDRSDILVQFSTGGAVGMSVPERIEALDLRPDMATLTTGTVNFGDDVFLNSLPMIREIAQGLQTHQITPEIEVFDTAMIETALRLLDQGLLQAPLHFDFVLGVPGGIGATSRNLHFLVDSLPEGSTWSVAAMGRFELPLGKEALELGGHVRVGLEDNIYLKKGVLAKGSYELVAEIAAHARHFGRPLASPAEARQILSLHR